MAFRIGQTVRLRPSSDRAELLRGASDLTGIVDDTWTDDACERVSVVYEIAQVYASGLPAAEFESDRDLASAPF